MDAQLRTDLDKLLQTQEGGNDVEATMKQGKTDQGPPHPKSRYIINQR